MSNYPDGDHYEQMLTSFRTNDLQQLLGAFGVNKTGRKSELFERSLELLRSSRRFNNASYLSKILEIHRSKVFSMSNADEMRSLMKIQESQLMSIGKIQTPQPRMIQPRQYSQQSVNITRAVIPQVMSRGELPQVRSQSIVHQIRSVITSQIVNPVVTNQVSPQVSLNQQNNVVTQYVMENDENASKVGHKIFFIPSSQFLDNVKFKKLPFFNVIDEIIKPTVLTGSEKCTLSNAPKDMKEEIFEFVLPLNHVNDIAMNYDISYGKNEYVYQYQIRICQLKPECNEVTDYLPFGLVIRLGNKNCALPHKSPTNQVSTKVRPIAGPINCSHLLKLNPTIKNLLIINWIPDEKTYGLAVNFVKKLTTDSLIKKLQDKGASSTEETKNYIVQKLADVDPDLETTSYRFSLICPLGKTRMKIPAKSIHCNHLQCFDAITFILMNEKKSTWTCPTCSKSCFYDDIQIQNYFLEIVTNPTLQDCCKEIEFLADGSWIIYEENKVTNNLNSNTEVKENTIDIVDLEDSEDEIIDELKKENLNVQESINFKESFVDLTISDDEEPTNEKNKEENEAQAADYIQSFITVDLKPSAQVQPQQAVTSSEHEEIIDLDS